MEVRCYLLHDKKAFEFYKTTQKNFLLRFEATEPSETGCEHV